MDLPRAVASASEHKLSTEKSDEQRERQLSANKTRNVLSRMMGALDGAKGRRSPHQRARSPLSTNGSGLFPSVPGAKPSSPSSPLSPISASAMKRAIAPHREELLRLYRAFLVRRAFSKRGRTAGADSEGIALPFATLKSNVIDLPQNKVALLASETMRGAMGLDDVRRHRSNTYRLLGDADDQDGHSTTATSFAGSAAVEAFLQQVRILATVVNSAGRSLDDEEEDDLGPPPLTIAPNQDEDSGGYYYAPSRIKMSINDREIAVAAARELDLILLDDLLRMEQAKEARAATAEGRCTSEVDDTMSITSTTQSKRDTRNVSKIIALDPPHRNHPIQHPNKVPIAQYITYQMRLLRHSAHNGFIYHALFMQHSLVAKGEVEAQQKLERRVQSESFRERAERESLSGHLATIASAVAAEHSHKGDHLQRNVASLRYASPKAILSQRVAHQQALAHRRDAPLAELDGWYDRKSTAIRRVGDAVVIEGEVVARAWTVYVQHFILQNILAKALRAKHGAAKRWGDVDLESSKANGLIFGPWVELLRIAKAWAMVRRYLHRWVARKKQERFQAAANLVGRFLRHHRRVMAIVNAEQSYRHSVISAQRLVRKLQARRDSRTALLHLQYLDRESIMLGHTTPFSHIVHNFILPSVHKNVKQSMDKAPPAFSCAFEEHYRYYAVFAKELLSMLKCVQLQSAASTNATKGSSAAAAVARTVSVLESASPTNALLRHEMCSRVRCELVKRRAKALVAFDRTCQFKKWAEIATALDGAARPLDKDREGYKVKSQYDLPTQRRSISMVRGSSFVNELPRSGVTDGPPPHYFFLSDEVLEEAIRKGLAETPLLNEKRLQQLRGEDDAEEALSDAAMRTFSNQPNNYLLSTSSSNVPVADESVNSFVPSASFADPLYATTRSVVTTAPTPPPHTAQSPSLPKKPAGIRRATIVESPSAPKRVSETSDSVLISIANHGSTAATSISLRRPSLPVNKSLTDSMNSSATASPLTLPRKRQCSKVPSVMAGGVSTVTVPSSVLPLSQPKSTITVRASQSEPPSQLVKSPSLTLMSRKASLLPGGEVVFDEEEKKKVYQSLEEDPPKFNILPDTAYAEMLNCSSVKHMKGYMRGEGDTKGPQVLSAKGPARVRRATHIIEGSEGHASKASPDRERHRAQTTAEPVSYASLLATANEQAWERQPKSLTARSLGEEVSLHGIVSSPKYVPSAQTSKSTSTESPRRPFTSDAKPLNNLFTQPISSLAVGSLPARRIGQPSSPPRSAITANNGSRMVVSTSPSYSSPMVTHSRQSATLTVSALEGIAHQEEMARRREEQRLRY